VSIRLILTGTGGRRSHSTGFAFPSLFDVGSACSLVTFYFDSVRDWFQVCDPDEAIFLGLTETLRSWFLPARFYVNTEIKDVIEDPDGWELPRFLQIDPDYSQTGEDFEKLVYEEQGLMRLTLDLDPDRQGFDYDRRSAVELLKPHVPPWLGYDPATDVNQPGTNHHREFFLDTTTALFYPVSQQSSIRFRFGGADVRKEKIPTQTVKVLPMVGGLLPFL
jgi:hypothetical protein